MSKSKGNVIDPLELIDDYGADALRFTLARHGRARAATSSSAESRVEGYRNFATKLWNAARFCADERAARCDPASIPSGCQLTVNRWIVGEIAQTAPPRSTDALEAYRFNDAARAPLPLRLGHLLRLVSRARQADPARRRRRRPRPRPAPPPAWVLDADPASAAPVMPFITEELWEQLGANRESGLIRASWPEFGPTSPTPPPRPRWTGSSA